MVSIVAKAPHSTVTPLRAAELALGGLDLALALAVEAEAEAEPRAHSESGRAGLGAMAAVPVRRSRWR